MLYVWMEMEIRIMRERYLGDIMIIVLKFDDFIKLTSNLELQWYYIENSDSFQIYSLLQGHAFQTTIMFDDIIRDSKNPEMLMLMFRERYLSHAYNPIKIDMGYMPVESSEEVKTEKLTTTQIGGEGTSGFALIPSTQTEEQKPMFPIDIKRKCSVCGYIGKEKDTCPKCGGAMMSMATGSPIKTMDISTMNEKTKTIPIVSTNEASRIGFPELYKSEEMVKCPICESKNVEEI